MISPGESFAVDKNAESLTVMMYQVVNKTPGILEGDCFDGRRVQDQHKPSMANNDGVVRGCKQPLMGNQNPTTDKGHITRPKTQTPSQKSPKPIQDRLQEQRTSIHLVEFVGIAHLLRCRSSLRLWDNSWDTHGIHPQSSR